MIDNYRADIEAQIAMARLAGIIECPGIKHKPGIAHDNKAVTCMVCQGRGYVSTEGKTTDTLRFWIQWRGRKAGVYDYD